MKIENLPAKYVLTHVPTGVTYIGSTKDLKTRLQDHRVKLDGGRHYCKALQAVYTSWSDISVNITYTEDRNHALSLEQNQIFASQDNPLVANSRRTANLGPTISQEGRQRLAEHRTDRKASEKTRQLMSERRKGVPRPRSEEGARSFSDKMTNRVLSKEHRENISIAKSGIEKTPEEKQRLVEMGLAKSRPISAAGHQYRSVKYASEQLGISQRTVTRRIEDGRYADWFYI